LHQAQYAGTDRVNQSLYGQSDDRSTGGAHYINENGLAFALHIPTLVAWPQERVQLDTLYPRVDTFASSGGATDSDWYMHLEAAQAFTKGNGILAPAPSLVGPGLSACQGSNE
ncbi:MAG: LruC domain-containing protein, partial [Deltaproteobacteria bacterium]|nr:LruC domain-containing protein [Deltaproteobacteria bacterium]